MVTCITGTATDRSLFRQRLATPRHVVGTVPGAAWKWRSDVAVELDNVPAAATTALRPPTRSTRRRYFGLAGLRRCLPPLCVLTFAYS